MEIGPQLKVWSDRMEKLGTEPANTCLQSKQFIHYTMAAPHNILTCLQTVCSDYQQTVPGCLAQSVTCLATDAHLTADPGVASSIPAQSHTFVEIDHGIIYTVILLPPAESFKKGCCQLQAKVCARSTG